MQMPWYPKILSASSSDAISIDEEALVNIIIISALWEIFFPMPSILSHDIWVLCSFGMACWGMLVLFLYQSPYTTLLVTRPWLPACHHARSEYHGNVWHAYQLSYCAAKICLLSSSRILIKLKQSLSEFRRCRSETAATLINKYDWLAGSVLCACQTVHIFSRP